MLYIYRLTIPKNTAESAKERLDFRLPYGILSKVEVAFTKGPYGLAHLQIFHDEHQLFPANPGESYQWNDYTIVWEGEYQLPEAWNGLSIRGWNLDDAYPHTITARLSVTGRTWRPEDLLVTPLEF